MVEFNRDYEEITVKSETIYDGRIVNLRVETVELPDHKYAKREIVDHARGACILPITSENKVILIKQYRKAINSFILEVPAGLVEANEDPTKAAERELQEEIGYKPGNIKFLFDGYASPGFTNEKCSFFLATDLIPSELPKDEGEFIEIEEFDIEQLERMLNSCEIEDMKTIICIQYALRYLKNE